MATETETETERGTETEQMEGEQGAEAGTVVATVVGAGRGIDRASASGHETGAERYCATTGTSATTTGDAEMIETGDDNPLASGETTVPNNVFVQFTWGGSLILAHYCQLLWKTWYRLRVYR